MKRAQPYTSPYSVSGRRMMKKESLSQAIACEIILFRKRSFAVVSRFLLLSFSLLSITRAVYSQTCPNSGTHSQSANENTYYPGTQATVNTGATSITLGAIGSGANFGNTPIASGDIVLIIQMQGAQISTTNNSKYGSGTTTPIQVNGSGFLTTGLMAGYMEFAVATNAVPITGGTLNIASGTTYSYAYSAYGTWGQYTYQVIRVPSYYNIKLTNTVTVPIWNGATGGVTVINAVNQLNFNSQTISAVGSGFRPGGARQLSGASGLNNTDYVTLSTTNANGSKGEGIAGTPKYLYYNGALTNTGVEGYPNGSYARGAPGNAGGGATDYDPSSNDQNSGGGGGGNGGTGGIGGWGWDLSGPSGGKGGLNFALPSSPYTPYYSPSRLIMGGGGGAATTNNGTGTPGSGLASSGAPGGGMVIISATAISGTGTINASGSNANNTVTIDASGGGGGGGSILIYAGSGQNGITAIANGGTGGSNDPASQGATQHGPGGGGGGGVIFSNAALNAASTVTGGANGISTGTNKTDNFGATSGANGVLTQTFPFSQLPPNMQICQITILAINLIDFNASYISSGTTKIAWTTSNDANAGYYEVERSSDASNFIPVGQVSADQSADATHDYTYNDYVGNINSGIVYYRLKMVGADGTFSYSKIVAVNLGQPTTKISVFPNPASDFAVLSLYSEKQAVAMMRLFDESGKQIVYKSFNVNVGNNSLMIDQLSSLPKGIYVVQVIFNNSMYNEKLVKN